jgi:peroxiredoxin Q/BCP
MVEVGRKAPAFRLKDAAGRTVSLSDFAGRWVVLYFYPRDDTPGCTTEACEFTASIRDFERMDAVVLGVSPDTPASHAKFARKHALSVTLLSDPERKALAAYDAYGEKTMYGRKVTGVIRSTVIVDPAGRVAHRWKSVRAAGHARAVAERLRELRGGGAARGAGTAPGAYSSSKTPRGRMVGRRSTSR